MARAYSKEEVQHPPGKCPCETCRTGRARSKTFLKGIPIVKCGMELGVGMPNGPHKTSQREDT